jgi:hypothetical protein
MNRRNAMIKKSALGALLLISMVGIASPAFAQRTHFGSRGEHAYSFVPPAGARSDLSPYATGGGSPGYNWRIEHDE